MHAEPRTACHGGIHWWQRPAPTSSSLGTNSSASLLPSSCAGSPVVYGATDALRAETQGHNKRLVVVPQAYQWANASQVGAEVV